MYGLFKRFAFIGLAILLSASIVSADRIGVLVSEPDGTPADVYAYKMIVPNGSASITGGVLTLSTAAAPSGTPDGTKFLKDNNTWTVPSYSTQASLHIDDILTALGIASEATDMGTYTGSTLTDNTTQIALNQELETAVETKQNVLSSANPLSRTALAAWGSPTDRALTGASATAVVANGGFYNLTAAAAATLVDFVTAAGGHTGLTGGEEILVLVNDANVTIDMSSNANIEAPQDLDFTGSATQARLFRYIYNDSRWNLVGENSYSSPGVLAIDHVGTGVQKEVGISAVDGYWDGNYITVTVDSGATSIFGQALHVDTDGEMIVADADVGSAAAMPALCLAVEAGTGSKKCLLNGTITETDWNWTVGGFIYTSDDPTTTCGLTQTAPSTTGDQVQVLGVALTADTILLNPSMVLVEVP